MRSGAHSWTHGRWTFWVTGTPPVALLFTVQVWEHLYQWGCGEQSTLTNELTAHQPYWVWMPAVHRSVWESQLLSIWWLWGPVQSSIPIFWGKKLTMQGEAEIRSNPSHQKREDLPILAVSLSRQIKVSCLEHLRRVMLIALENVNKFYNRFSSRQLVSTLGKRGFLFTIRNGDQFTVDLSTKQGCVWIK